MLWVHIRTIPASLILMCTAKYDFMEKCCKVALHVLGEWTTKTAGLLKQAFNNDSVFSCIYLSLVMRNLDFCICENKDADQLRGYREADQRLVFAIRIVQSLFYLNLKFQASSHLQWLYSPVCVGPGRKP